MEEVVESGGEGEAEEHDEADEDGEDEEEEALGEACGDFACDY